MKRLFRLLVAVAFIGGVVVVAAGSTASLRTWSDDASPASTASVPSGAAGMVVAVDPESGELGMPAAGQVGASLSIEDAQAYARQVASELVTVNHPDGSSSLIHDERLADYAVLRIAPDGSRSFVCVHGDRAAHQAACATTPAPTVEEK